MTMFDMTPFYSTMIGFDRVARLLDTAQQQGKAYSNVPPYDILNDGKDHYRISMALAGFTQEDITVEVHNNLLTISGCMAKTQAEEGEYLYRGIAERNFKTEFQLADHMEVESANLSDGLLTIDLVRNVPDELKPKKIEIKDSAPKSLFNKAKKLLTDGKKAA